MNRSADVTDNSYAACRRISRRARSNFYAGFLLLSGAKRRAMDALYAFARLTDDIADSAAPLEQRRRQLADWQQAVEGAFAKRGFPDELGNNAPEDCPDPFAVLPAVADAAERFAIPREHFRAMIDGAAMDLKHDRYETFDALEGYCRRVASSVGLACVHIWGFRSDAVFEPAAKCGIALQLTNILRDVKEDLARGRVYLPQEDLREHRYTEADLRSAVADSRFAHLMAGQIARAERYYCEGMTVLHWLEPGGRRVCGMMIDRYRSLLNAIALCPEAVLHRRVTLGPITKAHLALRWFLSGRRLPNAGTA